MKGSTTVQRVHGIPVSNLNLSRHMTVSPVFFMSNTCGKFALDSDYIPGLEFVLVTRHEDKTEKTKIWTSVGVMNLRQWRLNILQYIYSGNPS